MDYAVTGLLILCVVVLTISVSTKKSESFTELYFVDHTNLPKYSDGNFFFVYTIHNLENKDFEYQAKVVVEENGIFIGEFCQKNVFVKDQHYDVEFCRFKLDDFSKVKVKVILVNKEQDIYFWSDYVKGLFFYEGYGYGTVDCLEETKTSSGFITIKAKGSYANGTWPNLDLYVDGVNVETLTIDSNEYKEYTFGYNIKSGNNVIDIVFSNDYYNKETNEDRNVYFNTITLRGRKITDYVIDNAPNTFDCEKASKGNVMLSLASIRFKVDVE